MTSPEPLTSSGAFDVLRQQLDAYLSDVRERIGQAAQEDAYDTIDQLTRRGRELAELRQALNAVEKRFNDLVTAEVEKPSEMTYRPPKSRPPLF